MKKRYTQEDIKKAIQMTIDEVVKEARSHENDTLRKAILKEREECADICKGIGDKRYEESWRVSERCAYAIRSRI